jgi:hypothetical protein
MEVRVFETRKLRKICGAEDDVTGYLRKLHNEELCDLHSLLNIRAIILRIVR